MPVYADRVKETSTTPGTGTLTLAGAVPGFQSFTAALATGAQVTFVTEDGTNWEVAEGIFTASGTTLSRVTILGSSNAGAAVNWAATGARNVYLSLASRDVTNVAAVASGHGRLMVAGQYYGGGLSGWGSGSMSVGNAFASPFIVGTATAFDRLGTRVQTGVATAIARLAVYGNSGGKPGARVYDGATVDCSTTGLKELTITLTLQPGLYWVTVQPEVASPTLYFYANTGSALGFLLPEDRTNLQQFTCWGTGIAVSGSNPDPWYGGLTAQAAAPYYYLRAA